MTHAAHPMYLLGRQDAKLNLYPLYGVLVCAERYEDARQYSSGWLAITGAPLNTWLDRSAP